MAKEQEINLMLTKEDIEKAIEESQHVKEEYPAFWKLYEMIREMNLDMSALQAAMEEKKKGRR